jgi:hypothetical protein
MNTFIDTIQKSSLEIEKLQKLFKKSTSRQVKSRDEKDILKAVAITWFETHRPIIISSINENSINHIDGSFRELLSSADKSPSRQKCILLFKQIRSELVELRTENIVSVAAHVRKTIDTLPNFSTLVADPDMQKILAARWDECIKCVEHQAPLAGVVMIGGLLETLLLSKINSLPNHAPVYTAKFAPKNPQGKTLPLKEWTLKNYIEVGHELRWITQTARDLGAVIMDYRNYIHPFKQKTYNVFLHPTDASILWELCKSISKQLL